MANATDASEKNKVKMGNFNDKNLSSLKPPNTPIPITKPICIAMLEYFT